MMNLTREECYILFIKVYALISLCGLVWGGGRGKEVGFGCWLDLRVLMNGFRKVRTEGE